MTVLLLYLAGGSGGSRSMSARRGFEPRISRREEVRIGPELACPRQQDCLAVQTLKPVQQGRPILLVQDLSSNLDDVVGHDPDELPVEGGMAQLAERETVLDPRLAAAPSPVGGRGRSARLAGSRSRRVAPAVYLRCSSLGSGDAICPAAQEMSYSTILKLPRSRLRILPSADYNYLEKCPAFREILACYYSDLDPRDVSNSII